MHRNGNRVGRQHDEGRCPVSRLTINLATVSGVAGQVFSATPSHPLGAAAEVNQGSVIAFVSNGAGADATVPASFTAVLRRI